MSRYAFCYDMAAFGDLPIEVASEVVELLVEALARVDAAYLRTHSVAPLYHSGIVYKRDSDVLELQWWDVETILRRGWADCKGLAAWRIGELRNAGVNAKPIAIPNPDGTFHALVKLPGHAGTEDPSEQLGMR